MRSHSPCEILVCNECESVYHDHRWYLKEQALEAVRSHREAIGHTLCPACQKTRDKMPGGVVRLMGGFVSAHKEEILNLIRNEGDRAKQINPLERVMEIEATNGSLDILTTNERLAQRIGKAMHKAYSGDVSYVFSRDTKLARVTWHRD